MFGYYPQPPPNPMDFIHALKALDEYYKSLNPKKDGPMMVPVPEWKTVDYLIAYSVINAITCCALTVLILYFTK